jgi:hypothetical protein
MAHRCAMILGVSEYADQSVDSLPDVIPDSEQLYEVLEAEQIGGFDDVSLVMNPGLTKSTEELNSLFTGKEADDLILLHISSRMVKDAEGSLHFLLSDSRLADPPSTAISADWLRRQIARCHSSRIIVLIDGSCPGGAPRLITEKDASKRSYLPVQVSVFPPFGRVLIASELAINVGGPVAEHNVTIGNFTRVVCNGLMSGSADVDGDGEVTVLDLYGYLREELLLCTPSQTALLQTDGSESNRLVIARNPRFAPAVPIIADLTPEIRKLIRGPLVSDKLRSLDELSELFRNGTPAEVRAATLALYELAADDSRRVSTAARAVITPWADLGGGDTLVDRPSGKFGRAQASTVIYINNSEVYMSQEGSNRIGDRAGGDVNKQGAGRDMVGVAAGRGNIAQGQVSASITDAESLKAALRELSEEVSLAKIDVDDKVNALTALRWFQENIDATDEPSGTSEQVGKLRAAGGWIWEKFTSLMQDLPSAGLAAWLYELARHLIAS